ncbi:MAG: conjugal transfer protein TraD [Sphingobacteriia bacterium]|nr:conjugal transfer protein TraD [Sphingobacteriia bacterium]
MTQPTDPDILKLNEPGVVIEVDRLTAEDLGAFEEDALDEAEALASAEIDPRDVH